MASEILRVGLKKTCVHCAEHILCPSPPCTQSFFLNVPPGEDGNSVSTELVSPTNTSHSHSQPLQSTFYGCGLSMGVGQQGAQCHPQCLTHLSPYHSVVLVAGRALQFLPPSRRKWGSERAGNLLQFESCHPLWASCPPLGSQARIFWTSQILSPVPLAGGNDSIQSLYEMLPLRH